MSWNFKWVLLYVNCDKISLANTLLFTDQQVEYSCDINSEYVEIWYAVKHDDNEKQGTCNLTQL